MVSSGSRKLRARKTHADLNVARKESSKEKRDLQIHEGRIKRREDVATIRGDIRNRSYPKPRLDVETSKVVVKIEKEMENPKNTKQSRLPVHLCGRKPKTKPSELMKTLHGPLAMSKQQGMREERLSSIPSIGIARARRNTT